MATARHTINVTAEGYGEDRATRDLILSLANELKRFPSSTVSRLTLTPFVKDGRYHGWVKVKARMTVVVSSSQVPPNVA